MSNIEENNNKRPRGRPPISGEAGHRYQVYLPTQTAQKLRGVGNGSLSRGIVNLSKKLDASNV